MKTKFNNSTRQSARQAIQQFNNRGFTLLELIIVFTVIAILSAVGIASLVDYSRVQIIQSAASDLESTINMAKSRALSQTKPFGCENRVLQGYEVDLDTNNNSYTIWAVCSGSLINPFSTINKTDLPKEISFDMDRTTTDSIFFPVLTSGVQNGGVIALTGYNQSRCISMGGGALVQLQISTCAPIATSAPTPNPSFDPNPTSFPTPIPSSSPTPATSSTPLPTPTSMLFVYTGNMQTWTVPLGVTEITIDALGAAGIKPAGSSSGKGGYGGQAKGTFSVTPGQTIYIYIGASSGYNGGGTGGIGKGGGSNGGSGGGASDIRLDGTALTNRVLVAGGGGGGGGKGASAYVGSPAGSGGTGGGLSGGDGGGGTPGGTQTAGGLGSGGGNGSLGVGGKGASPSVTYHDGGGGGGGGGGYYGGAGGDDGGDGAGDGGGGGSSFISSSATNASTVSGVEQYYGQVTISY